MLLEQVAAVGVDMGHGSSADGRAQRSTSGFQTDTAISGRDGPMAERELVAWAPDEDVGGLGGSGTLT